MSEDFQRRALSFGGAAEAYHRGRPSYSAEAAAWLVGTDPCAVLELGAGTGKLTRSLVELGHEVYATDPDEASAAFVQEAFRHHKTVGLVGRVQVAGVEPGGDGVAADPSGFFEALAMHRHWGR